MSLTLLSTHCVLHDQWNSPGSVSGGPGDRGRNYLIQASPGGEGGPGGGVRTALLRHHSPDSSGSEAIPGTGIKKDRVMLHCYK